MYYHWMLHVVVIPKTHYMDEMGLVVTGNLGQHLGRDWAKGTGVCVYLGWAQILVEWSGPTYDSGVKSRQCVFMVLAGARILWHGWGWGTGCPRSKLWKNQIGWWEGLAGLDRTRTVPGSGNKVDNLETKELSSKLLGQMCYGYEYIVKFLQVHI